MCAQFRCISVSQILYLYYYFQFLRLDPILMINTLNFAVDVASFFDAPDILDPPLPSSLLLVPQLEGPGPEFATPPPLPKSVADWCKSNDKKPSGKRKEISPLSSDSTPPARESYPRKLKKHVNYNL